MLSDEEKQAIKDLIDSNNLSLIGDGTCINSRHTIGTILNLIEKQSKEIEELKEKYSKKLIEFQKEREWYEKNHISKDKIKAKIEEVKDGTFDAKIVLQSLLEKE